MVQKKVVFSLLHAGPDFSPSFSAALPVILYSSRTHFPRSMSLHRSEQNGLQGFSSHVVFILQIGQVTLIGEELLQVPVRKISVTERIYHVSTFCIFFPDFFKFFMMSSDTRPFSVPVSVPISTIKGVMRRTGPVRWIKSIYARSNWVQL